MRRRKPRAWQRSVIGRTSSAHCALWPRAQDYLTSALTELGLEVLPSP